MECKNCASPLVEGATYCGYCGLRMDGRKPCKACGKLNDENVSFCVYCGTRIDGKKVCTNCGTENVGDFCCTCGKSLIKARNVCKKPQISNIFSIIGEAFIMLGVLFSLIFVFLIGLVGIMDGETMEKMNIFYFFGDYYKEIESIDFVSSELSVWWKGLIESSSNTYGIIGTVLTALILLGVVVFSVLAIVGYVRSWLKGNERKSNGFALATIIFFLVGAIVFYNYSRVYANIVVNADVREQMIMTVNFNKATISGIVLCSVCTVVGVVFSLIAEGKKLWEGKEIGGMICAIIGVLIAGVLLGLSQFISFAFEMEYDGTKMDCFFGFGAWNVAIIQCLSTVITPDMSSIDTQLYNKTTALLNQMNVYDMIAQVSALVFIVFAGVSLLFNLRALEKKGKTQIIWSSIAMCGAILTLVFAMLAWGAFESIIENMANGMLDSLPSVQFGNVALQSVMSGKFSLHICGVVFAVFSLTVSIVRAVFVRNKRI